MTQNISTSVISIGAVAYELGDVRREIASIEDAERRFRAVKLPLNHALLGCKYFRQSTRDCTELLSASIAQTLGATALPPAEIDLLVIASASPRCLEELDTARLLENHGLRSAMPLGVTLQECASLLSAIELARQQLLHRVRRHALVVSVDIARDDAERIKSFGVLGDAASSCIVSGSAPADYRIVEFASRSDLKGMKGHDDFGSRKLLAGEATAQVLKGGNATISDVGKVFSTNFFTPVMQFNAATLQLRKDQVHSESAAEVAHCACADPLINLCQYRRNNSPRAGELLLLQSYAPGFVATTLLRREPP